MATKPATIFTFATDANFGSGPASGFPTKIIPGSLTQGFIPGSGINAEWVNYLFNVCGQWLTDWLDLGSPVATLDAHIVETDANGKTNVGALEVGGTISADRPFEAQANSGIPATTALIENFAGGAAALQASAVHCPDGLPGAGDDGPGCKKV